MASTVFRVACIQIRILLRGWTYSDGTSALWTILIIPGKQAGKGPAYVSEQGFATFIPHGPERREYCYFDN